MFDRLLVGVDGSACGRRAARVAMRAAKAWDASVAVIHVAPPDEESDRGTEILAEVRELGDAVGMGVETDLERGNPPTVLTDRAHEDDADLVAVGRQGETGLTERLLGSTAERVVRRSGTPTLVVPNREDVTERVPPSAVLAPTDGSETGERAAPAAATAAAESDAPLHVVSAVDVQSEAGVFDAGGVSRSYVERLEAAAEEKTASYADEAVAAAPDVELQEAVVRGPPHEAIEDHTEAVGADLVVMASRGEATLAGHVLGSVADRVLRVVDVPVLVVPAAD
ncbi:MAG: universal stress protein [Halobacteriaceae archaeon]